MSGGAMIYRNISSELLEWVKSDNPNLKARKVRDAIELLTGARVIFPVMHSSGNGVPLNAESRQSVFKLYFLDAGLMSNMTGIVHSPFHSKPGYHQLQLMEEGLSLFLFLVLYEHEYIDTHGQDQAAR